MSEVNSQLWSYITLLTLRQLKQARYRNLSVSFIFPMVYNLLIFDFSTMSYKSLKLFTFFLEHPVPAGPLWLLSFKQQPLAYS